MRREIHNYIHARPDLIRFIRENPIWYRQLSRSPEKMFEIDQESKVYYGKTLPQRIDRLQQNIQLANMLVGMIYAIGNNE